MAVTYLGLGSNLGNRRKQLITAMALLAERAGDILAYSAFHETEAWGFVSENRFLNAAVKLQTDLPPLALLHAAVRRVDSRDTGARLAPSPDARTEIRDGTPGRNSAFPHSPPVKRTYH